MHPVFTDHAREADPDCRAAQVSGVGHQRMTIEPRGEQLLAVGDALLLAHLIQPGGLPRLFSGFDDKGRKTRLELVGMHLEPAVRRFSE